MEGHRTDEASAVAADRPPDVPGAGGVNGRLVESPSTPTQAGGQCIPHVNRDGILRTWQVINESGTGAQRSAPSLPLHITAHRESSPLGIIDPAARLLPVLLSRQHFSVFFRGLCGDFSQFDLCQGAMEGHSVGSARCCGRRDESIPPARFSEASGSFELRVSQVEKKTGSEYCR